MYFWKCCLQNDSHFVETSMNVLMTVVYFYNPKRVFFYNKLHALMCQKPAGHDDVIKWKHFPRYWPFVRGIHRWPVNFPYEDQWRRALMFSLICAWTNGWVNNRDADDLRRHYALYDVTVIYWRSIPVRFCHITTSLHGYYPLCAKNPVARWINRSRGQYCGASILALLFV